MTIGDPDFVSRLLEHRLELKAVIDKDIARFRKHCEENDVHPLTAPLAEFLFLDLEHCFTYLQTTTETYLATREEYHKLLETPIK